MDNLKTLTIENRPWLNGHYTKMFQRQRLKHELVIQKTRLT